MTLFIEILQLPLNQLYIYSTLIIFIFFVRSFYAPSVILGGINLLLIWMLISSFFGIRSSISWNYYLQLSACFAGGYFLLVLLALAADKWGRAYNGEGFIVLIAPLNFSLAIILPAMAIKAIWSLMRVIF